MVHIQGFLLECPTSFLKGLQMRLVVILPSTAAALYVGVVVQKGFINHY